MREVKKPSGSIVKHPKLLMNVAGMFNDPKYSDVTIRIFDDIIFHAHQIVICTQSEYFEKAVQKISPSADTLEPCAKIIELKVGSRAACWRTLEYLYSGNYSKYLSDVPDVNEDSELLVHVRVHAVAEMLSIEDLKAISETRFRELLQEFSPGSLFGIPVPVIYSYTNKRHRKIRSILVSIAKDMVEKMNRNEGCPWDSTAHRLYREALENYSEFAVEQCLALSGIDNDK
ncbi:hypothetical protein K3495_g3031 [Podosphaera aphanis]|nr:hypothetical protein K3495_g3031 [Podosphaera aphanis]